MKILVPVDSSDRALAPIAHLARTRTASQVLLVNVQPLFPLHLARFSSRAARDALRAERSALAMAGAIEALADAGVPFRALAQTGLPAARIAAVAERERVDEIMIGAGRHPAWLRWLNPSIAQGVMARTDIPVTVFARGRPGAFERFVLPAGIAGVATLLLAAD
jgi:nucleotide-binding universal stress UspA family protein